MQGENANHDPELYGAELIDPLDLPDDNEEENNAKTQAAIEALQQDIYSFKKQLFSDTVSNDTQHDASDLGAMSTFHALYLQLIGYWIGLLDGRPVPAPRFSQKRNTASFLDLTRSIQEIIKMNADARILVYSMLFDFSVQHPFNLGPKTEE
jgi:hypothetical protein